MENGRAVFPRRFRRVVCGSSHSSRLRAIRSSLRVTVISHRGAVGLLDQKWDGSRLVVKVAAVGGFPQVVRFAVPKGWKVKSATSNGEGVKAKEEHDGRVVAVELSVPRSCVVDLCLDF